MPTPTVPYLAAITLLLAACSRAPDMATCGLVGTWDTEALSPDAGGLPKHVVEASKRDGTWPFQRFDADGAFTFSGYMPDGVSSPSTWRILDARGDRIMVEIASRSSPSNRWRRTFEFVTPDRIRDDLGLVLVRVALAK